MQRYGNRSYQRGGRPNYSRDNVIPSYYRSFRPPRTFVNKIMYNQDSPILINGNTYDRSATGEYQQPFQTLLTNNRPNVLTGLGAVFNNAFALVNVASLFELCMGACFSVGRNAMGDVNANGDVVEYAPVNNIANVLGNADIAASRQAKWASIVSVSGHAKKGYLKITNLPCPMIAVYIPMGATPNLLTDFVTALAPDYVANTISPYDFKKAVIGKAYELYGYNVKVGLTSLSLKTIKNDAGRILFIPLSTAVYAGGWGNRLTQVCQFTAKVYVNYMPTHLKSLKGNVRRIRKFRRYNRR